MQPGFVHPGKFNFHVWETLNIRPNTDHLCRSSQLTHGTEKSENHWPTRSSQEMRFGMLLRSNLCLGKDPNRSYSTHHFGQLLRLWVNRKNLPMHIGVDKLNLAKRQTDEPYNRRSQGDFHPPNPLRHLVWDTSSSSSQIFRVHLPLLNKFPANRMISLTWNIPRCPENVCEVETHRKKQKHDAFLTTSKKSTVYICISDERRAR